jgi:hypothetical protein
MYELVALTAILASFFLRLIALLRARPEEFVRVLEILFRSESGTRERRRSVREGSTQTLEHDAETQDVADDETTETDREVRPLGSTPSTP